ncbi:MAG: Gfo/Idh/MocA family oxidoreductase [Planctomycetes bacterium]|nr:Gfo/Idh/MocA family oxidoreductase [Planctomycetota bacterium]
MLNHAIVGCGVISGIHATCLGMVKGSRLVAVMDIVPEKAKALGEKAGVPWFTDRDQMLREVPIDVIHVCTPSGNHHEIAIWAAQNRKHCFCEKPMDVTLEAMDLMTKAFKKSGTYYGGCFMNRFNPPSQLFKKAVEAGRFGRIATATAQCIWWRTQEYYDSGDWRGTWELDGGGCLMNQGVHYVDMLQWLVGSPVKSIRAYTGLLAHERIAVEDTAVAILKFANGALGVIHGTTAAYPGPHGTVEVCGDKGNATYEGKITRWQFAEEQPEDKTILETGGVPPVNKPAEGGSTGSDPAALGSFHVMFTAAFQEFSDAIQSGTPNALGLAEHRKAVEIILGIYESARRGGEEVKLPLKKAEVPVPLKLPSGYAKQVKGADRPPLPAAMVAFRKKQSAAAKKGGKARKK